MISFFARQRQRLPEELCDWLVALSLLPHEGDDGRLPETEGGPRHRLQSPVEEVIPRRAEVDVLIRMPVLPVQAKQPVQRGLYTGGTTAVLEDE